MNGDGDGYPPYPNTFSWQVPGRPWQTITPQGVQGQPPAPIPGMAGISAPLGAGPHATSIDRGLLLEEANRIQQQREAAAQQYLARVKAGQRAALAQQQLGLGGMQQQQMAAGARGPLAQRAAMYGQSRAAGDMIAQQALAAAQEEQAAQALLQQTYGAGAQQQLAQAQQGLQQYGIAQQTALNRQKEVAAREAAEDELIQQVVGASIGSAATAATMSDRRLKQNVRRPRTAAAQELLRALMEVDDG